MSRVLPSSPNLEYLKKEAKAVLHAAAAGAAAALERFRAIGTFSAGDPPALSDAQHLLAKEYGFENWSSLKAFVLQHSSDADPFAAFAAAVRDDDLSGVSGILSRHAKTLRSRLDDALPDASFGGIAMTVATGAKNKEMVDVLLAAGADVNAKTHWWAGGFSALDVAGPAFASFLLTRGAALTAVGAARLGMFDELKQLLDADPSRVAQRGGDGQTPLHTAANVDIARLLLDRGADIDALDVDHESTPAMYHVRDRTDVTKYLMSRGCRTDLLMAVAVGDLPRVRDFLDRDPTAIRTTVSEKYFPKRSPRAGGTIYIWTLGGNKTAHAVARDFGQTEALNFLISRTPDAFALAIAAQLGDASRVQELLAVHPNLPSTLGDEEKLMLVTSAEANDNDAVALMLGSGWPSDVRQGVQATPLHWAAFHGNAGMVRDLLHHGAPVDAVEATFNGTPLGWALHGSLNGWHRRTGDYVASVKALLNAGATVPSNPNATPAVLAALRQ